MNWVWLGILYTFRMLPTVSIFTTLDTFCKFLANILPFKPCPMQETLNPKAEYNQWD